MKQAWANGMVSVDESAMLDALRKSLNITPEEHIAIEAEIRREMGQPEAKGVVPTAEPERESIIPTKPTRIRLEHELAGVPKPPVHEEERGLLAKVEKEIKAEAKVDTELAKYLKLGKETYNKNKFSEAIEYYQKALELDPENTEAKFFIRKAKFNLEKMRKKGKLEVEIAVKPPKPPEIKPEIKEEKEVKKEEVKPCAFCGGTGKCHWCKASGDCYWCKGTGLCSKCKGSGKIDDKDCEMCKGSGKCHSCKGSGECYWCRGSGRCTRC